MAMKVVIDSLDDVAEGLRTEYKEGKDKDGKTVYHLDIDGDIGFHPQGKKLKDENAQRRQNETKLAGQLARFAPLGERDVNEILTQLDRIPILEEGAKGKLDEKQIAAIVEGKVKTAVVAVERERDQLKTQVADKDKVIGEFTAKEKKRFITVALNKAGKELKVLDSAVEDIEMYAGQFEVQDDETVVHSDGRSVKAWLEDMQAKRPHWWGTTGGGGAGGGKGGGGALGENPFTAEHWNMTKQSQMVQTDRPKAERMAAAAGTSIGGRKPAPKK